MAADVLEALGIARGDYVLKVNSRKILDGIMAATGIVAAGQRLAVLRAIDKQDKFPRVEIEKLLGAGRKDESGDFTPGAGLDARAITVLFDALGGEGSGSVSDLHAEGLSDLEAIETLARAAGYGADRIRIDRGIVRGLEYYTGAVFEAELLFDVRDAAGRPQRFGSVGGGGRYDGLVARFLDTAVPATGFSIGVSRLLAALEAYAPEGARTSQLGPVVMLALDRTPEASIGYQSIVAELRRGGIAAELYLGEAGLKAQMKYADRRRAPIALLQGSNERERGEVLVKDLILGAELTGIGRERAEYREAQESAQRAVPVSVVLEAVRAMLAAQAARRA
jgi:histidyl-tRNA synthetase